MKFGGSSVADAGRIRNVAELVRRSSAQTGEVPVVVVSAMGGVTDRLFALARAAAAEGRAGQEGALRRLAEVRQRHEETLTAVAVGTAGAAPSLADYFSDLR